MRDHRGLRWLATVVGLSVLYFFVGKLGRAFVVTSDQVALLWPATGLAVAALILGGLRLWPGIWIGTFCLALAELPGVTLLHPAATATGNAIEASLAAFLLTRLTPFSSRFEDQRDILRFIVCSSILASPVSATFGVLSMPFAGVDLAYPVGWHWSRWWIGNAMGVLLMAPPILTWARRGATRMSRRSLVEGWSVSIVAVGLGWVVFTGNWQDGFGSFLLSYLLLPFVAWMALRFGVREATTLASVLALIAAWGLARGQGPFTLIPAPFNVATFWPFVAILAIAALFLGTLRSERSRAEAEKREGLWLLRTVVDALPAVVRVCDDQGRILLLNRTQAEVFGRPAEGLLGKTFAEIEDDAFGSLQSEIDLEVVRSHEPRPFEEIADSAGRVWLQTTIPLPPSSAGAAGAVGSDGGLNLFEAARDPSGWRALTVAFDITARERAERALERAEGRLRSILETAEGWILTVDPEGCIRYANRPFADTTLEEMIGSPVSRWVQESMREGFDALLAATLTHGRGGSLEVQSSRPPYGWLDCRLQPVIRDGQPVELILSILDIEKRKRAEVERERLLTEMQRMKNLESLGVLAGGIAHDFNNLLTGVIGNASLAAMKLPPESELQPFLAAIEKSSEQAAELCQQMLAFAGKGQYVAASVDLSAMVRGLVKILRGQLAPQIEIRLELAEDLAEIRCDPTQLRRVVINLITNAADALAERPGTIGLRTGCRTFEHGELQVGNWSESIAPGSYLFLEVSDTGHGMDAETLDKIYEPFFSTKFMGRGLGMAAASGIMRSYHGAVQVDSTAGEGTFCRLFFPFPGTTELSPVEVDLTTAGDLPGIVLLADDEAVVAQVARQTLEDAGYAVLLAEDGRQALDLFQRYTQQVAIAVLDMTMPEITGAELLQRFRRVRPELPVLLSSGFAEEDLSERLGTYRWTGFIKKPYRPQELLAAVCRALAETTPRQESRVSGVPH